MLGLVACARLGWADAGGGHSRSPGTLRWHKGRVDGLPGAAAPGTGWLRVAGPRLGGCRGRGGAAALGLALKHPAGRRPPSEAARVPTAPLCRICHLPPVSFPWLPSRATRPFDPLPKELRPRGLFVPRFRHGYGRRGSCPFPSRRGQHQGAPHCRRAAGLPVPRLLLPHGPGGPSGGWPVAAGPGDELGKTSATPARPSSLAPGGATALAGRARGQVPEFRQGRWWSMGAPDLRRHPGGAGGPCPGRWVWPQGPVPGAFLLGCPQAHGMLWHAAGREPFRLRGEAAGRAASR